MSNHAYESAAALRPSSNGPIPISTLCERFSLVPASADDSTALNDLSVLGVSVDSGDTSPGELFVGLPGFTAHGARFAAEAVASGAVTSGASGDGLPQAVAIGMAVLRGLGALVSVGLAIAGLMRLRVNPSARRP